MSKSDTISNKRGEGGKKGGGERGKGGGGIGGEKMARHCHLVRRNKASGSICKEKKKISRREQSEGTQTEHRSLSPKRAIQNKIWALLKLGSECGKEEEQGLEGRKRLEATVPLKAKKKKTSQKTEIQLSTRRGLWEYRVKAINQASSRKRLPAGRTIAHNTNLSGADTRPFEKGKNIKEMRKKRKAPGKTEIARGGEYA